MDHGLVTGVEEALGWDGPQHLGAGFARGSLRDQDLPARVLTPTRLLDLVMRRNLGNPQIRCFQDGKELHPGAYLHQDVGGGTGRDGAGLVHMGRLGNLLREGTTMVLDRADVFDPTLEVACRSLQWWSGERATVNIYLTTNAADGFGLHWDDHDVLVVQLSGEKDWEVRGPSRAAPLHRDAARNDTPGEETLWAGTVRPGDVLHIPRGYWHRAGRDGRGSGHSLHMTFGFSTRTGASWLSWLADRSREQELFRRDLAPTPGSEQHRRLAEAAVALVGSLPPADFLAAREHAAAPSRHVPFLETFGHEGSVICVCAFRPRIRDLGETVEVLSSGKKLTFKAKALPALRLLLSGRPVPLDRAAEVVGAEVHPLAEILMRHAWCAPLTPGLASGCSGLVAEVTDVAEVAAVAQVTDVAEVTAVTAVTEPAAPEPDAQPG
ncbi:Cupin superfamily protein [Streptomyces sp. LamerLS-316]|uniref:JmjC domain-containing protein n=1 Tax=unclassified Streptomyces TaxID=2593676 RepID=UPI000823CA87|nr:cupin domain-containing protein [Streptomyces sp. LamerLS-316]MYQ41989.1 cupin [Streptomyces sp. SID4921]SCK29712.1 Cupin superfamily protein [Streptomyces sp. LamerLS-316]